MDRLIVKNFGPLKDVDIEINKINLFIGENGSGKSVLGKLITIITNIKEIDKELFLKNFEEYNINYFSKESIIKFSDEDEILLKVENKEIFFGEKYLKIIELIEKATFQKKEILDLFDTLKKEKSIKDIKIILNQKNIDNNILNFLENKDEEFNAVSKTISQYIPAERNLISLFNKSLTTLLVAGVPLPKFLLQFSSEFEKAGNELKELEFLNVKYVNGDGLDRHKIYFNDEDYLPLEHSSSGIQSVLPLYLTVKYFANRHSSIIIEEPEQNLFPKAQAETIKYIVEQVSDDNNLFMMTHSPYVLSTLNNLLYAYTVGQLGENEKKEVKELIDEKQWINPDDFSAYYLENGVARSIKSDIGLIADNEIDNLSEEMGEEFDELLEIYRASKND